MAEFPRFSGNPRFPGMPAGGPSLKWLVAAAALFLVLSGLARGVYTVGPESVGVIQRFGRFVGTVGPGLRFKLPFGIDTVTILPVKRQLKMDSASVHLAAAILTRPPPRLTRSRRATW